MHRFLRLRMLLLAPAAFLVGLVSAAPVDAQPKPKPRARLPLSALTVANPAALLLPRSASLGVRAALIARRFVGVPYRWGGESPAGFDCSGLVSYVYGRLGVQLPHNAAAAYSYGRPVPASHLRPGDLLFFRGLGHVGLYLGSGRWIHAPQSGETVRIDPIRVRSDLVGARRLQRF